MAINKILAVLALSWMTLLNPTVCRAQSKKAFETLKQELIDLFDGDEVPRCGASTSENTQDLYSALGRCESFDDKAHPVHYKAHCLETKSDKTIIRECILSVYRNTGADEFNCGVSFKTQGTGENKKLVPGSVCTTMAG